MVTGGITDNQAFRKAVGGGLTKQTHINGLEALEKQIVEASPLNIGYDLSRPQKPYFDEFGYTEILGTYIYVYPLSTDVACRLVDQVPDSGDPAAVLSKSAQSDKYTDMASVTGQKSVVFLPGSNLIWSQTSKEMLYRTMHEDRAAVIKPHPLTDAKDIRKLKLAFGITRLLEAKQSGFNALLDAHRVYVTPTTELGIYATLMLKDVHTVGQFFKEHSGTYYPLYRLRNQPLKLAKAFEMPERTGLFHKDTSPEKIHQFFEYALSVREFYRPLASSYYNEAD
ncbi:hypothetical protein [Thiomicrospira sp. XS5]|uniref:hypothetical protein n=1 Tax=Thiomicrospira sp. XS5 TaxID=1775636 RepID=UPI00083978FD|nr:hypothetical protein [Thiomicrospira sp. XS5]